MVTQIHEVHECEAKSVQHISTLEIPYHYVNSGLPNVYLVGVKYYVCASCKQQSAEIPALEHLLTAIARAVIDKPSLLNGPQVRFLRKRLSKRSKDFAAIMSITPQRLSTIESSEGDVNPISDKLVRMIYKILSRDKQLMDRLHETDKVEKWLTSIHGRGSSERILATWQKNHQWKVEAEPIAA